jgi:hypothetical protein
MVKRTVARTWLQAVLTSSICSILKKKEKKRLHFVPQYHCTVCCNSCILTVCQILLQGQHDSEGIEVDPHTLSRMVIRTFAHSCQHLIKCIIIATSPRPPSSSIPRTPRAQSWLLINAPHARSHALLMIQTPHMLTQFNGGSLPAQLAIGQGRPEVWQNRLRCRLLTRLRLNRDEPTT